MNNFFKSLMKSGKAMRDAANNAVRQKDLDTMQATPTIGGIRQVISGHPAEGLDPIRLAHIHRSAAQGEPLQYFELAEDIEERDLHYAGVMATRKRSVAQLPITVKAASDSPEHQKHADFVRSWIDDEILQDGLFDMLDAIGKGISVLEIEWKHHMGRTCPAEFVYRPQRWFTFDKTDGETILLRDGIAGMELAAHKYVKHRHKSKSGLTIRSGLSRLASWAWMFKQFTLKDWAIFCQNYGQPIRIGRYGRNATEDEKDILWRAVTGIAGDCAAIMPGDMNIEFHGLDGKAATAELYERRADWLDRQISKAVLGQTTTTDAVSGGHAVSKEHRLVQEDIERSDAIDASTTINRQVIPNMVAFNFGPQELYPKIRIGRPDEPALGEFATAFSVLAPQGLTAPADWMRERLSIPAPKDGEVVVGGRIMTGPSRNVDEDDGIKSDDIEDKQNKSTATSLKSVHGLMNSRHERQPAEDAVDVISKRLEQDAAGALAGMAEEVRDVFTRANTLEEASDELSKLQLDPAAFSDAMARGMALAHLAGQASLIDDITDNNRN